MKLSTRWFRAVFVTTRTPSRAKNYAHSRQNHAFAHPKRQRTLSHPVSAQISPPDPERLVPELEQRVSRVSPVAAVPW